MRTFRVHVLPLGALLALLATVSPSPDLRLPRERAPTLLRCAGAAAAPVRQQVGPAGGDIELPGGHGLLIPRRSLAAARSFEVSELRGDSVGVRIRGGEGPMSFQRYAVLTISYRRCQAVEGETREPIIVRIDPGGVLTPFPSQHDAEDRSVTTILSGNSDYALAWP
jgi:hypothetical protein